MCGIVGIVYNDTKRNCLEETVINMRDAMIHRGPDEDGLYLSGNVGLGHRRLSIIDLSTGRQPMTNEDKTLWIVYNGEIYNFKSLREDLVKRGHIFRTNTDTEVILHLYEEKGIECVKDLNGMFAFAILDEKNQSLFIARDRMGIKPVYYAQTENAFLFASEIKSLVKCGVMPSKINNDSVFEYFIFRQVSGENTMFSGVKSLLPGHILILEDSKIKISQYWSSFPTELKSNFSFEMISQELLFLIEDAVKIRLMSDVPLGTFCSGGLDSSLITAIAARELGQPINTFSVGFYEEDYDEVSFAKIVSKQYGTNHHVIKVDDKEFVELLPKMIWQNDEPLNFANSVHIYAVSRLAKNYVTVVLTGEGSDELFGGYPRYYIPKLLQSYQQFPLFIQKLIYYGTCIYKDHRIEKLKKYANYSFEDILLYNSSFLDKDFLREIFFNIPFDRIQYRRECLAKGYSKGLDFLTNLSLLDQHNYLVSILNRQDKMSMAASIESRVPFLDYRIVELSNLLPIEYKMNHFKTKRIIKKIARNFLPDRIIDRKKSGFGVPLRKWFGSNRAMNKYIDDICEDLGYLDYFDKSRIKKIVRDHRKGIKDYSELLWTIINFEIWRKLYFS